VNDATLDPRFNDNPLVNGDPNIRFYAGAPLVNSEGFSLGTLCVIDRVQKDLDANQINALKVLSNQVIKQLELRKRNIELHDLSVQLKKQNIQLVENQAALESINRFVTQLVQAMEVNEVIVCITDHLQNDFKFGDCTVFFVDDEKEFIYDSSYGVQTDYQIVPVDKRIPVKEGVSATIVDTGKALIFSDGKTGSILSVPVFSDSKVIAIIELRHKQKEYFNSEHLELLTTVANLSSSKLRNSVDRARITISQKNLTESEERLRKILDMALEAVVSINADGIVTGWNPRASQIFGFSKEEAHGQRLSELIIPQNYREAHEKGLSHYAKTGEGPVLGNRIEITAINKSRNEFPVELTVVPVKIGDIYSATAFIRDISAQKKAEQEMKDALEKQKQLTDLKSKFVSMTSHEFRTPLTTIQANVELLMFQMKGESPEKREKKSRNFNRILDEIKRLTNLMNDILMLGRLESGKIPFNPLPVNIVDLCQEIIQERYNQNEDGLKVEISVNGQNYHYKLDSNIYTHIITNLLSNAFKYSKGNGNPRIELNCEKNHFELKVIDSGIGIPGHEKDKIFETFHRASNADDFQGTGLGLSIVMQFLNLHDGEITVESEEGKGSTFAIYQPSLS
jgi:PAS domain S-box-containing protein